MAEARAISGYADSRRFALAAFGHLDPENAAHRRADQIGRCAPFTSPRWPDMAQFSPYAVPIAQIGLKSAGRLLNEDLGTGILQVWLHEFAQPELRHIPDADLMEPADPFGWGERRLRGSAETDWVFLTRRDDALVHWKTTRYPMFPQFAGTSTTEIRLGGYPAFHPDLLEWRWFGDGATRVLLQIGDLGATQGWRCVVISYTRSAAGGPDFDCVVCRE